MLRKLKDNRGFTLIELLMVMIILGILAQIALVFLLDLKRRSSDVTAVADGRNLITIVRTNFVNLDDVDYTQISGSDIGTQTTGGAGRSPVFTLSRGVMARIIAGSASNGTPENGYFEAYLYHIDGTPQGTPSGKREFYYCADELTDTYAIASF